MPQIKLHLKGTAYGTHGHCNCAACNAQLGAYYPTTNGMRLGYYPTTNGMLLGGLGDLEPLPGALTQFNRYKARVGSLRRWDGRYSHVGRLGRWDGRYSHVGRFGTTTVTGQVVSAGASGAASGLTGAEIGTAVFPGFGTAVGAIAGFVVGMLTSKLFGHANQGQIQNDVLTRMKYADAYKALPPGTYPGRYITAPDLLLVWYGLLHEGYFPQAEQCGGAVLKASLCPPQYPNCNCGAETWANGMVNGTDNYEFPAIIATANRAGVYDPVAIVTNYILPGLANLSDGSKNAHWALPQNTTNGQLVTQLYIDVVDAYLASKNPNVPITYGNANAAQAQTASAPVTPSGGVVPQVISTAAVPQPPSPATTPAPVIYTASGGSIVAKSGQSLITPQGTITANADGYFYVNGAPIAGPSSNVVTQQMTYLNGQVIAYNSDGAIYQWTGSGWNWNQIQGATAAPVSTSTPVVAPPAPVPVTPAANLSPNGASIAAGSLTPLTTAQGSWTLSASGIPTLGAQSMAGGLTVAGTQLAILNGSPTMLGTDGSTWGWNGSAWTQLTPASATLASQVATPYQPSSIYSSPGFDQTGYTSPIAPTPVLPVDTSGQPSALAPPGTVAAATVGSTTPLFSGSTITAIGVVAGLATLMIALRDRKKASTRARR